LDITSSFIYKKKFFWC